MKKLITVFVTSVALMATVFAATVNLSWNPPSNTADVTGYRVYYLRSTSGVFSPTNTSMVFAAWTSGASSTTVSIPNLASGFIRFRATSYSGNPTNFSQSIESDYSNEVSTTLTNVPGVPVLLRINTVTP